MSRGTTTRLPNASRGDRRSKPQSVAASQLSMGESDTPLATRREPEMADFLEYVDDGLQHSLIPSSVSNGFMYLLPPASVDYGNHLRQHLFPALAIAMEKLLTSAVAEQLRVEAEGNEAPSSLGSKYDPTKSFRSRTILPNKALGTKMDIAREIARHLKEYQQTYPQLTSPTG